MFQRLLAITSLSILAVSCPVHSHAADPAPLRIVTLGDSITKGVRTGVKPEETFAAILAAQLKSQGRKVEVVNVGIGGERTDQALARLERDVLAQQPQIVTIMYGANDSYVDKGQTAPRLNVTDFRKNTVELVSRLKAVGIQPVLMTEPRQGDKHPGNGLGEHPNLRMLEYIVATREVSEQQRVPLVDHFADWTSAYEKGTDIELWMTDHIHPNPAGHQRMTDTMRPVIAKLVESRAGK
jgi:lysophospholipase L1-like esterase